jgi:hypothetical protein
MSSNTKIFTTLNEWKQMTPKQQQERMYSLHDYIYDYQNETLIIYNRALRNMFNPDDVEEYNQILRSDELFEFIEKTKDAWIHAKTELELVDESFIHENNKKAFVQELNFIQKEIAAWNNIELLTSHNKPCVEDLHQFPFSSVIVSGVLPTIKNINKKKWCCFYTPSTVTEVTEVTILKTNNTHYPFVRIERNGKNRKSMIADYITVAVDKINDMSILQTWVEQKHITSFEKCSPYFYAYHLYFDIMTIETMPNLIEKCKQAGFNGEPETFMSLND